MLTLMNMAANFVRPENEKHGMQTVEIFYRNKPTAYFEDIMDNHAGMMHPYMKDFNGDPGSPINGQILGLFFAGKVDRRTLKPPTASPFGEIRLTIPAHRLVNDSVKLYFGDFYCHNLHHYVTIVATKHDSVADVFCRRHLPLLNLYSNPYLQINNFGYEPVIQIASEVWVELFFTGSIDIPWEVKCGAALCSIRRLIGRGSSKVGGIVKNPLCNICNLYPPLKRAREENDNEATKSNSKIPSLLDDEALADRCKPLKAKRKLPPSETVSKPFENRVSHSNEGESNNNWIKQVENTKGSIDNIIPDICKENSVATGKGPLTSLDGDVRKAESNTRLTPAQTWGLPFKQEATKPNENKESEGIRSYSCSKVTFQG